MTGVHLSVSVAYALSPQYVLPHLSSVESTSNFLWSTHCLSTYPSQHSQFSYACYSDVFSLNCPTFWSIQHRRLYNHFIKFLSVSLVLYDQTIFQEHLLHFTHPSLILWTTSFSPSCWVLILITGNHSHPPQLVHFNFSEERDQISGYVANLEVSQPWTIKCQLMMASRRLTYSLLPAEQRAQMMPWFHRIYSGQDFLSFSSSIANCISLGEPHLLFL